MHFNWQMIEAIGACVAAIATLINVGFFIYYLKLTRRIHQAAIDQAEGQSQPVIVVACRRELPEDAIEWLQEKIPTEIEGDTVRLVNIGNGPALNLRWKYERVRGVHKGDLAYLSSGDRFIFPFAVEKSVGEKSVECEYVSRSGTGYVSKTTLRDRYVVSSSSTKVKWNT